MFHLDHMHPLVHVLHEVVEVDPVLRRDIRRESLIEQIHQHRLATSNIAVHVQTLGQVLGYGRFMFLGPAAEEGAEERGLRHHRVQRLDGGMVDGGRVVASQSLVEVL